LPARLSVPTPNDPAATVPWLLSPPETAKAPPPINVPVLTKDAGRAMVPPPR
jgi:hypothetical protein